MCTIHQLLLLFLKIFLTPALLSNTLLDLGSSLDIFQHCIIKIMVSQINKFPKSATNTSELKFLNVFETQSFQHPVILRKFKYIKHPRLKFSAISCFSGISTDHHVYDYTSIPRSAQYYSIPRQITSLRFTLVHLSV